MSRSCIVLGSGGLVGSAVRTALERDGWRVSSIGRDNYDSHVGAAANALVNCNGNTYRFKAAADPAWDFDASVSTVVRSLFDFKVDMYVYISTIDVYNDRSLRTSTGEDAIIEPRTLEPYAFHKWLAERVVERHARSSRILRCGTVIGPGLRKGPLFDLLSDKPVYMTTESRLSLIDMATIARVVVAAVRGEVPHDIVNVTGTGNVTLLELARMANVEPRLASDAHRATYHYDIENTRLSSRWPTDSSRAIAARFIEDWSLRTT